MSDRDSSNPLTFQIERGAAAAGLVSTTSENLPRCRATNARGEPCRAPYTLVGGDGYCAMHRPGAEQENRRRRRQGGRKSKGALLLSDLPELKSPTDAETWLETIGRAVATGVLSASAGQVATSAVRAWLSAHEQGRVAEQVEELRQRVEDLAR